MENFNPNPQKAKLEIKEEDREIIKQADIICNKVSQYQGGRIVQEADELVYEWGSVLFKAVSLVESGHPKARYLLILQALGNYVEKNKYNNMLDIHGFGVDSLNKITLKEIGTHPLYHHINKLKDLFRGSN